ncbi:peptidyl-prolyl cis-trans isomerase FKBP8 [Daktulosphaira vitifoliae]|uniref:peptidyl-prolyl cis-trans isomerase FKBP8 n=1 Tax=Daktulosphaira vitifoliae TaxID=58002 RepID=UPI0021AA4BF9|nr:peptidyl-prolyl cis-trans isomerase FKBP8 [Daktulosphaira vitifoliae]
MEFEPSVENSSSDIITTEKENLVLESNKNHDDVENIKSDEKTVDNDSEDQTFQDILGSGDLTKKIIKHGTKDNRPTRGEQIVIHITGRLEDNGDIIEQENNLEITLGDCEVIQGVDLALSLMNVGEIAELKIAPRFGYGDKGLEPKVPPGINLLYTVELVSAEPELSPEELIPSERLKIGQKKKEKGNWWYSRNENTIALHLYRKALQYFGQSGEIGDEVFLNVDIQNERIKTLNNIAAVHMSMNSLDLALQSLESVLAVEPNNLKAVMRKGKVLADRGHSVLAAEQFKKALTINPNDKAIKRLLTDIEYTLLKEKAQEKELYKKMLGQKDVKEKPRKKASKMNIAYVISALVAGLGVVGGYCYLSNNYSFNKFGLF